MYRYVYFGWIDVIGISEETFGLLLSAKHMSQLNVQQHMHCHNNGIANMCIAVMRIVITFLLI
jgi:hypothetical protein